jgi:hypothetical protein
MSKYTIQKIQVSTATGAIKSAWNVIDKTDGYVYDTFDLKRDAQAWINNATKLTLI